MEFRQGGSAVKFFTEKTRQRQQPDLSVNVFFLFPAENSGALNYQRKGDTCVFIRHYAFIR